MPIRHTISAMVETLRCSMSHIRPLFQPRVQHRQSLGRGNRDATISRMTIVVRGDDRVLEQVVKQLNRLVDVIRVIDITQGEFVERELALIKREDPNRHAFRDHPDCGNIPGRRRGCQCHLHDHRSHRKRG